MLLPISHGSQNEAPRAFLITEGLDVHTTRGKGHHHRGVLLYYGCMVHRVWRLSDKSFEIGVVENAALCAEDAVFVDVGNIPEMAVR